MSGHALAANADEHRRKQPLLLIRHFVEFFGQQSQVQSDRVDRLLFGPVIPLARDFIGISVNLDDLNVALDPGRLP